jgi:hypothetical protein
VTDAQAKEIIEKLDRLLSYFEGRSPGEVRRRAKADVLSYLTKHKIGVNGEHGGEGEGAGYAGLRRAPWGRSRSPCTWG